MDISGSGLATSFSCHVIETHFVARMHERASENERDVRSTCAINNHSSAAHIHDINRVWNYSITSISI